MFSQNLNRCINKTAKSFFSLLIFLKSNSEVFSRCKSQKYLPGCIAEHSKNSGDYYSILILYFMYTQCSLPALQLRLSQTEYYAQYCYVRYDYVVTFSRLTVFDLEIVFPFFGSDFCFLKNSLKAFSSSEVNASCPPIKSTSNSNFFVFILQVLKIFINKF